MLGERKNMKALILKDQRNLVLEECSQPALKEDEVLIKTKMVGICGSDLHAFHGMQPSLKYPCIMGHEIVGTIEELNISKNKKIELNFHEGDRVVINPTISCGKCYTCLKGRSNVCENLQVLGVHINGGFAEFVKVNVNQLYKIPEDIPDERAVLVEPLSIAAQIVNRGNVSKKDFVVIFGAGPIGLSTLAMIKEIGSKVCVIDTIPLRRNVAKYIGADMVINAKETQEEILKQIKEFSLGHGPSIVIDTATVEQTAKLGAECIARAGRVVVVGLAKPQVSFPYLTILKKELDLIGVRLTLVDFNKVMEFVKKSDFSRLLEKKMITHVFPFDESIDAFQKADERPEETIKVIVRF